MNKRKKALIAVGGTGGHVYPGYYLAKHLIDRNFDVNLVSDKRGLKYLNEYNVKNIFILPSSPLKKNNIFLLLFTSILIFFSILRSLFFLIFNRPSIIFGMGGYGSFPICIAASVLRIKYIIYENNLIVGKANKYLLPFAKKIFVSSKDLVGIPNKYQNKIIEIGNILKKEIINLSNNEIININKNKLNILVIGGSQAAKVFAEILPNIFKECINQGVSLKIYQQCLPSQNNELKHFYEQNNIEFEIFNFSKNLIEYFFKTNLAITRSGASMLAELTNAKIPFISVPLPSSAENHQQINAEYYQRKKFAFLIEEKNLSKKLSSLIKDIYRNMSKLDELIQNQRQYSDKNVYKNIDEAIKKYDEKN